MATLCDYPGCILAMGHGRVEHRDDDGRSYPSRWAIVVCDPGDGALGNFRFFSGGAFDDRERAVKELLTWDRLTGGDSDKRRVYAVAIAPVRPDEKETPALVKRALASAFAELERARRGDGGP